MRTRIALVAIIPIALITVSTLTQAALAAPAQATITSSSGSKLPEHTVTLSDQLVAFQAPLLNGTVFGLSSTLLNLPTAAPAPAPTPVPAPAPAVAPVAAPAPPPGPVDTVTPDQRAEWDRVAMCEEGGDWSADGGEFSGGLGINRTNWAAYGGDEYAPEGAEATPDEQIMVAERIQSYPPDQDGCRGW